MRPAHPLLQLKLKRMFQALTGFAETYQYRTGQASLAQGRPGQEVTWKKSTDVQRLIDKHFGGPKLFLKAVRCNDF